MENEIAQYEDQLKQVKLVIASLPNGEEKQSLCALEADLLELIKLCKQKLNQTVEENTSDIDPLFEEYNLFKAELAKIDEEKNVNIEKSDFVCNTSKESECSTVLKELNILQGTKCQAPFLYKWANDVTYHNAFICQVPAPDEIKECDKIKVKVMFTNPTHEEMLPCPYYLKGNCRFSDDKCRYSHGEYVLFSELREYREPVFSTLSIGSQVFAKQADELWHRGVVIKVNEKDCVIKFESNSREEFIALHNIYPLDTTTTNINNEDIYEEDNDSLSDFSSDNDSGSLTCIDENKSNIIKRILESPAGSKLGEWEKFTKGFGSKIMAKMGYIHGSGLGKNGLGRIEPVSAVILPPGKSLDHCMLLKSKGGEEDLLKIENKLKRRQKKHEEKLKKAYEKEKNKTDIFTFLNEKLLHEKSIEPQKMELKKQLKNESTRNLNVTSLQLYEEIKKVEKEIKALNQSLTRHPPNTHAFNVIKDKLKSKKDILSNLHISEVKIKNEQNQRRDRKKLTVF